MNSQSDAVLLPLRCLTCAFHFETRVMKTGKVEAAVELISRTVNRFYSQRVYD